ncbi:uncharacterized protein [Diabrotica undecimpunctata]|uniref:uncharacterized protein n=1 Tax=Diabrotica undecimpunctata TaxID=50387 RepID=UPI003B6379B5
MAKLVEQSFSIKLVQEVEKHPCLYNYTLNEYSRKDITEKAWNDIGRELNLTGTECKEKWKNLRAVFVRHMKSAPSGSSAKSKKPYYLTDVMQFTLPYVKVLNSATSGNLPRRAEKEIRDDQEEENWDDDSQTAQPLPSPKSVSLPASSQNSDSLTVLSPQSFPPEIPLPLSPVHQNYSSSKRKDRNKKSKDGSDENFDE